MASLYDRLKSAQPLSPPRRPQAQGGCLVETRVLPLSYVPDADSLKQALRFLAPALDSDLSMEDFLFLDTETTGLSRGAGTLAFLVGYGQVQGCELRVTQVLMRDYPQEKELLTDLLERLDKARCLVTYNGASFDVPLLQGRLTMNRLRDGLTNRAHLDLLHAARQVFKMRLGRCPLTRLEEMVFGLKREGDLPGAEIPARYFAFLDSQDEGLLRDILDHNRQDIHTLAALLSHLLSLHSDPLASPHPMDLYSLGRAYERQGHQPRAIACYRACGDQAVRGMARLRMAELYRKQRLDQEAAGQYEEMLRGGMASGRLYISLAKIYEHRFRDPARALEIARQGMLYCSQRIGFSGQDDPDFLDLEKRSLRLMRKAATKK